MKKAPLYYCDNCGLPVPAGAGFCPHCGEDFRGVRCPNCSYQGDEKSFKSGCPVCGFLASSPEELPYVPVNSKRREKKKRPLPGWFYTLSLLGLLGVLVLFIVLLVLQIL